MQLIYLWIENYKNIENKGFNFSPYFKCNFDGINLTITHQKHYSIFPNNINITAIVGENGSGKSSLIYQDNYLHDTIKIVFRKNKLIIFEPTTRKKNPPPKRQIINIVNNTKYKLQYYSAYEEFKMIENLSNTLSFEYDVNNINYKNTLDIEHSIYFNTDVLTYFDYQHFVEEYMYDITKNNQNLLLNLLQDDDHKLNYKIFYEKINEKIRKYFDKIDFNKFIFIPTKESLFKNKITDIQGRTLFDLSSGEKYLFLITFLLLTEVLEKNTDVVIYLDEPELTLHPQWQKELISNLIHIFSNLKYIIHFVITTHSPFLLSDIPKVNTIFLKKGKQVYPDIDTFGANIHTLLSHGFFIENGLMGEFAKNQIDNVINYLNNKVSTIKTHDEAQNIINIIGEPIIKRQLQKMMDSKNISYIAKDVKSEIEFLQHRINLLNKRL